MLSAWIWSLVGKLKSPQAQTAQSKKKKKNHTLRVHLKYDFIKQKQEIEFTATAEIPLNLSNTPIFLKKKKKHQLTNIFVLKSTIHIYLKILWAIYNQNSSNKFLMWLHKAFYSYIWVHVYTDAKL